MTGIGHYLKGDGVLNQGYEMLSQFIPRYISLGTMGLLNQDQDENGLPTGIGVTPKQDGESDEDFDARRYKEYMEQIPGYGADGYSEEQNNGRAYFGLGPVFSEHAIKCELISPSFPRSQITYREILPESEAELPETIDIVYSAYISTGALKQFRGDNDYLFITEVGMWNDKTWRNTSSNGLLAAYRIIPPNSDNWDMDDPANREILQRNILRVGKNQIVQVIWKLQLGSMEQFGGYVRAYRKLEIEYIKALKEASGKVGISIQEMDVSATGFTGTTGLVPRKVHITCDPGYYFDYPVTCSLGGNVREKSNSVPAIGVIGHFFGYCDPIFISPLPDGVLCTVGNDTVPANRTIVYDGVIWYWSTVNNGVGGSYDDSEGNILTYPNGIDMDDYSASGSIAPHYIKEILEYVHASAWEEF